MSILRIGGLASGMDINAMVDELMKAERMSVDKLVQNKQILQWQQEDYRSLNTALFDFRYKAFDMKLQAAFDVKNATSSDESVISVTAGTNSAEGTYTITVNNLATGVSKGSTAQLADEKDIDGNSLSLYQQFTEFQARGLSVTDNISVTINGTALTFDLDTDNINTVVSKINEANLGIKANYDNTYNRFFLTTTSTGSDANINITSDAANFISNNANNSILKLGINEGVVYSGTNASVNLGDAANLESSTNTILVNGLTLNLKDTGASTVQVNRDIDKIVESITGLINSYNDTIGKFYSKVQEKSYRDYLPLSAEQKKDMTEKEVELWEAKAHSGLLRNDTLLNNFISNLRASMSRVVDGTNSSYNTLSKIGISTISWNDNGKLYINESTLRAALSDDPEGVKKLFANSSTVENEKGIAAKLYDIACSGINFISDKAGSEASFSTLDNSYIGKRLMALDVEIEDWQVRLSEKEDRYWRQFTAMETAINQMNAQSAWLSQQLGTSQ